MLDLLLGTCFLVPLYNNQCYLFKKFIFWLRCRYIETQWLLCTDFVWSNLVNSGIKSDNSFWVPFMDFFFLVSSASNDRFVFSLPILSTMFFFPFLYFLGQYTIGWRQKTTSSMYSVCRGCLVDAFMRSRMFPLSPSLLYVKFYQTLFFLNALKRWQDFPCLVS